MLKSFRERLIRACGEGEQSSLECKHGFVPRKGKLARRERDCTVDCTDVAACLELQRKAYWKEEKRNEPDPDLGKGGSYGDAYRSRFMGVGGLEDVFASRRVLQGPSGVSAEVAVGTFQGGRKDKADGTEGKGG